MAVKHDDPAWISDCTLRELETRLRDAKLAQRLRREPELGIKTTMAGKSQSNAVTLSAYLCELPPAAACRRGFGSECDNYTDIDGQSA